MSFPVDEHNPPRKIARHGFRQPSLYYGGNASASNDQWAEWHSKGLDRLCAIEGCGLPYESEVHWILEEEVVMPPDAFADGVRMRPIEARPETEFREVDEVWTPFREPRG